MTSNVSFPVELKYYVRQRRELMAAEEKELIRNGTSVM